MKKPKRVRRKAEPKFYKGQVVFDREMEGLWYVYWKSNDGLWAVGSRPPLLRHRRPNDTYVDGEVLRPLTATEIGPRRK